jgi:ABC-2 type transport system permease protein
MKRLKHPILDVVSRETERILKNPAYRFLLFSGPLIGILLLYFIFQQGVATKLPIAVVNQDNSSLSIKISNALNASADVAVVEMADDMFQAKKMLEQAIVDAVVLLPKDLEKNVFQGIKASVPVYINGTNVLVAGTIQRSVLTTLGTISGGIQLKKLMYSGDNQIQAMTRVMPVNMQKHILFNPYTNYNYFLNSAMLYVMLYLFSFLGAIYTFGNELKKGTGKELLETSSDSIRLAVAGKLIPYTVIFSGFAVFINYLLFRIDGMPLNGNFLVIFFGQFLTIVTYQLMGVLFVAVTKNLRLALSVGSAYTMMGITFSGLTFPLEGMPAIARVFACLFPFTWWEKIMISQSLRGAPVSEALVYMCYILIFLLVSLAFIRMYKTALGDSKYWGKS